MKIVAARQNTVHRIPNLARSLFLFVAMVALIGPTFGANGLIYYNRITSLNAPATLRRVGGDGTGDQALPVNLPSPIYPTISRDGRFLLVTSPDPGRPFKISNNVFIADLFTGALGRTTSYEDEVVLDGALFARDLLELAGKPNVSSYKVNFPYHKAFSPDGSRVVVMNLFKSGSVSGGTPFDPGASTISSGRFPVVDVYRVADALPDGPYIFLAAQERDGFNQGGDGIDWHPALNEVVAAVASDIPATGTSGRTSMEGTVLAVFATTGISPFLRKLTSPVGQADSFFDVSTLISTATAPNDYAPAISPNGQQVAYVRHLLRQDTRFDGAGIAPLPSQCSIRVINYNGTGDHEVLRLTDGLWITKVAWSPNGSQIAFDVSPQLVLNGLNSLLGDVTQSAIHLVNTDGTNPLLLIPGPAAYPAWSPGPPSRPTLQITRNGDDLQIRVDGLTPGQAFRVEGSTLLPNWGTLLNTSASSSSQLINITPNPQASFAFYRVVVL